MFSLDYLHHQVIHFPIALLSISIFFDFLAIYFKNHKLFFSGWCTLLSGFGGEGGADALGPGMSAALITTFYGTVFANLFFLPMSEKLNTRMSFTSTLQAMLVEAARLIHQKKHPLIVREKLNSFIPPKEWKKEE